MSLQVFEGLQRIASESSVRVTSARQHALWEGPVTMHVSVEFAHAPVGSVDWFDVSLSCLVAGCLVRRLDELGYTAAPCLLIDDKNVASDARQALADHFLSRIEGLEPFSYCFERDLADYVGDLVSLLSGRPRRRLTREIEHYRDRYQALPCSVDIAIWHLLRLRILSDRLHHIVWLRAEGHQSNVESVISVLGNQSLDSESLAKQNILRHLKVGDVTSRIVTIFYPETFTSASLSLDVDEFVTSELKRALRCEQS